MNQMKPINFEAVVFDMDGVIFDSEQAIIDCWLITAEKYHIENIVETCHKCLGVNYQKTCEIMYETYGADFPFEAYGKENSKLFQEKFGNGKLPIKPGVEELLKSLKSNGKKVALASSTRKEKVEQELRDAKLLSYFDVLVCGDMVSRSKPFPDIYLKACEELGVTPESCYAIEDSFNGIRSAHAGGLYPIMVPDILQPNEEIRGLSHIVLKDLHEVNHYLFKE